MKGNPDIWHLPVNCSKQIDIKIGNENIKNRNCSE